MSVKCLYILTSESLSRPSGTSMVWVKVSDFAFCWMTCISCLYQLCTLMGPDDSLSALFAVIFTSPLSWLVLSFTRSLVETLEFGRNATFPCGYDFSVTAGISWLLDSLSNGCIFIVYSIDLKKNTFISMWSRLHLSGQWASSLLLLAEADARVIIRSSELYGAVFLPRSFLIYWCGFCI